MTEEDRTNQIILSSMSSIISGLWRQFFLFQFTMFCARTSIVLNFILASAIVCAANKESGAFSTSTSPVNLPKSPNKNANSQLTTQKSSGFRQNVKNKLKKIVPATLHNIGRNEAKKQIGQISIRPSVTIQDALGLYERLNFKPNEKFYLSPIRVHHDISTKSGTHGVQFYVFQSPAGKMNGLALTENRDKNEKIETYVYFLMSTGGGIGQTLMKRIGEDVRDRATKVAKKMGRKGLTVTGHVSLDSIRSNAIIEWYEKLGFKRTHHSDEAVPMERLVVSIPPARPVSYSPIERIQS